MKTPCPACKGSRGQVIAEVLVTRRSSYGEWRYVRYTHRTRLSDGRLKRKYCYSPAREGIRIERQQSV